MGAQRLLISDIDGTLLGDVEAAERFRSWFDGERHRWRLAYATGRTIDSVMGLVADGELVAPDAIVSSVGTEIHDAVGAAWPGWPPSGPAWDRDLVLETIDAIPGVVAQPASSQSAVKASYHAVDLSPRALDDIRRRLSAAGLTTTLVYSSERDLDVLPAWGGKSRAARFLATAWGSTPDDVIACGDSGNDLDLLASGVHAVVVGNAGRELAGLRGPRIYRAQRRFADGVLEGIRHWETRPPLIPIRAAALATGS